MSTATFISKPGIRLLSHILFLAASYLILLRIFRISSEPQAVDHIYTTLFMLTLLPVIYINLEVLIPRLGRQNTWFSYLFLLLTLTALFVWINVRLFEKWSARLLPDYYFISYYRWWDILLFFAVMIVLTTLIKLSKSWFMINELRQQLLASEKQKIGMELSALKAQVNPHFFFNTLNSIYSLSLQHDPRLPAAILQLSGIMRYYLYESGEEFVPLEKEISVVKNYIALQQIRSESSRELKVEFSGDPQEYRIAPMLLMTFVENAFKHVARKSEEPAFIHIRMDIQKESLRFTSSNIQENSTGNPRRGMGLENVKRRLELLYPERHRLEITSRQNIFTVKLELDL